MAASSLAGPAVKSPLRQPRTQLPVRSRAPFSPSLTPKFGRRASSNPFSRGDSKLHAFSLFPAGFQFPWQTGTKGPKQTVPTTLKKLLSLIEDCDRGLTTSKEKEKEIRAVIDELAAQNITSVTTGSNSSATWRLLFTTEQETLFIVKNAGLFGTKAGEVYQVLDVSTGQLQNVITFPPGGAFVVDSSVEVAGSQRVNFQFTGATLITPKRRFNVPPFGKGWFESVYVDRDYRVAKDVRGDVLVLRRDGPPRDFLA